MKKKIIGLALLAFGFLPQAHADWADQYLLLKGGIIKINLKNADPLLSLGILYGFGLTPEISLESELNFSLTGGEYADGQQTGEYSLWTGAIYGAFRWPVSRNSYAKLKVGALYEQIERTSSFDNGGQNSDGFGSAGGIGFGLLAGKVLTLELEATAIDEDIVFFSLGGHYRF